jgi:hypothetical protein
LEQVEQAEQPMAEVQFLPQYLQQVEVEVQRQTLFQDQMVAQAAVAQQAFQMALALADKETMAEAAQVILLITQAEAAVEKMLLVEMVVVVQVVQVVQV